MRTERLSFLNATVCFGKFPPKEASMGDSGSQAARQHMHKHDKPYRCPLSGCPNKDGFARKDQLERHIKNVRHDQVP